MNVPFLLLIILFILMIIVGGKRGVKSFFTLILNFVIMLILLILIGAKFDPLKVTIIGCIIITITTLFFINSFNLKTLSSLFSVVIVVALTLIITYNLSSKAQIQGFGKEQAESLGYLSTYVQLNFSKIVSCQILLGLLGAIIDVSISISSSLHELYLNNPSHTKYELFKSGINIGKDILGTMTNTLLFAYIGSFMTLSIYFSEVHYSFYDILNTKVFCSELFQSFSSGIGIILIIPITSFITSRLLFSKRLNHNGNKKSYSA
ncbi:putative membrane protein [Clostridium acetobutylicum]|uniref:Uncharacterized conserved membrane protein n=1 Tax=Clostridium acetobutylicum (strain ATCC 824 / DSM 792 / JCM 1419 / IAM 19013 / LMG 5710 / NBRC 13948 / NRRL B-527 / VKM B-1787 / 2291 / W) TaxID=272562 RepID=Q97KM8_CLOAB|nr:MULTISPECIES: YibE/F family protein [Clostridium]AAK78865.1 Uncharacterized conserved membrane protein [Clostridium acetobutylicum ATCC 824]ADZ19940.1 Conserved hypothetical protein [Clostridium acetobutylicum EA 2018]AEI31490.1 hypothetical protein SMB_G0906 [Clostridium acetobutylicum DSM 1731]AWV80584.1 YibE/F family protein [Clostridium acetobutylicum]MBC2392774.1 YibE/F family protein [Clostridium acetobutylicum]